MARQVNKLIPKNTLFLLCDIQDKFRPGMKYFDIMVQNANKLVKAGRILDIPLIVTEHYPERLGHIVKEIDVSHAVEIFSKTKFSMCIPSLENKIQENYGENLKDVVLFGLESHICLEQTAIDLLQNKSFNVHVVGDAIMSRLLQDRDLAIERMRHAGCIIQTSESVIFSLMQDAKHPKFKEISKLVRDPSADAFLSISKM